jgi:hypothetical protein
MLCIRSEHAIGFLKGRFQSLKNLRLHIKDQVSHVIATYWVAACIGVHAFAVQHEEEEQHLNNPDFDKLAEITDPFIEEGLTTTSESDTAPYIPHLRMLTRLQLAKKRREELKEKLFHSKLKKAQHATRARCRELGVQLSSSESLTE